MKRIFSVVFIIVVLIGCFVAFAAADGDSVAFLPILSKPGPTWTPVPTAIATSTQKPMATQTGTATNTPTVTNTPTASNTPTVTNTATPMPPTATSTPVPPTMTPTPHATSPSGGGGVEFVKIVYDPSGLDSENEYVEFKSVVPFPVSMGGWRMHDIADNTFIFPSFTLQPGATVRVYNRSGTNNATTLYWGINSAVWNNNGDTGWLKNGLQQEVHSCSYNGGGSTAFC